MFPEIETAGDRLYIVTDAEAAIVQAIRKILPDVGVYRCWNHVIQDCERHLPRADGEETASKIRENYKNDLYELMRSNSKEEYQAKLILKQANWKKVCFFFSFNIIFFKTKYYATIP